MININYQCALFLYVVRMKKENVSLTLSIVSLFASVISACWSFPRSEGFGIDYLGLIVGMLAFLTAMLIAFIWNGYALRDKEIDKKLDLLKNSSVKAIAEDMFYTAYKELYTSGNLYFSYQLALKKAIAALNLDFSEEKAELIFGQQNAKDFLFFWGKENQYIDNQIDDLKKIKNKSNAVESFINTLVDFKKEKDRENNPSS